MIVGFQIHVSNSSDFDDTELVHTDTNTASSIQYIIVVPLQSVTAQYVRISVPGINQKLNIKEFEVYGGEYFSAKIFLALSFQTNY